MGKEIYKWIGLSIITYSIITIVMYDIYTRQEFMITQIIEIIYGLFLIGLYLYKERNKQLNIKK